MLAFRWGLASVSGMDMTVAKHVNQLGWLATFAFVMCGALRLARFNIQTRKPPETAAKRYFVGLPIPAGAGLIAAVVHFFKTPILLVGAAISWCFLILLVSFLMISTVKYSSFKDLNIKRARVAILAAAMLIGLVIFYSEIVLLVAAAVYAGSGPAARLAQTARRFLPGYIRPEPGQQSRDVAAYE
jgi:CDP-diacylglycerol--serine O-phosphatidyltransferase